MNTYERAVIDAACEMEAGSLGAGLTLSYAVQELQKHRAALAAAQLKEIPWREVVGGDELRGKSGAFYPVTGVLAIAGAKRRITVTLPTGPHHLTRPTPAEPKAVVRRGPTGDAVDVFVNVFSSGVVEL